jgi:hypothetical protein
MNSYRNTEKTTTVSPSPALDDESAPEQNQRTRSRKRELIFLGGALLVGFVLLPIAIYVVGTLTLGPYAGGQSLGAFLAEFFRHLSQGAPRTWFIALSPYMAVWAVRLLFRANPWAKNVVLPPVEADRTAQPEAPNSRREPFISS